MKNEDLENVERNSNHENFKKSIYLMIIALIPMLVASFLFSEWKILLPGYTILLVILLLSLINIENIKGKYIKLVMYLYICILLGSSLVSGVVLNKGSIATAFLLVMIMTSFLLADKPLRIDIFLFGWVIVFVIATCIVKEGSYKRDDIINAIIVYVLSCYTSAKTYMMRLEKFNQDKELIRISQYDMLTELPNRRKFYSDLNEKIGQKITMFMIDIDHFKIYNDNHGHAGGDDVLITLGKGFNELMSEEIYIYRFGGEEFIGYSENLDVEKNAKKILDKVNGLNIIYEESKFGIITVSVGAAKGFLNSEKTLESIIKKADEALYEAKKERNTWVVN